MSIHFIVPFILMAETAAITESGYLTLANAGVSGVMLGWFMWRDKQEREARDKQHSENGSLQRDQTNALNLMTRAMMVELIATRHMDSAITELATKIKEKAETGDKTGNPS